MSIEQREHLRIQRLEKFRILQISNVMGEEQQQQQQQEVDVRSYTVEQTNDLVANMHQVDANNRLQPAKRANDSSPEEDGVRLSKYQKLTTDQTIHDSRGDEVTSNASSVCSDNQDTIEEVKGIVKKEPEEFSASSSSSENGDEENNGKDMETDSDSAVSLNTLNTTTNEIIDSSPEIQPSGILGTLVAISPASKVHTNTEEEFMENESGLTATQPLPEEEQEFIQNELPDSSNEIVVSTENFNNIEIQLNENDAQNSIQIARYDEIAETPVENMDISIKQSNSVPNSQAVNEDELYNEQVEMTQYQSTEVSKQSQDYPSQQFIQTQPFPNGNLLQIPSTSGSFPHQGMAGTSGSTSVSDLNLTNLILSMREDIQKLSQKVEKQETILDAVLHANQVNVAPLFAQSFPEKYGLKIPFTRMEDFYKFNENLGKDIKFCNEFIQSLTACIDNNVTFSKNILSMLRKYMTKELVMSFTASKATPNKEVMKETLFCQCLLQATRLTMRNGLLPLEHERTFMKNLGTIITGAKSWPTHNDQRQNHQVA